MRARLVVLVLALLVGTSPVMAQGTRLTVTGFSGAMPAANLAAFDSGYVHATSAITLTVQRINGGGNPTRTVSLYVRAASATMGTSAKPIGDLQWRYLTGAWVPLSTTNALIRPAFAFSPPTSLASSITLRMAVNWANTPPDTYTAALIFTMIVTSP